MVIYTENVIINTYVRNNGQRRLGGGGGAAVKVRLFCFVYFFFSFLSGRDLLRHGRVYNTAAAAVVTNRVRRLVRGGSPPSRLRRRYTTARSYAFNIYLYNIGFSFLFSHFYDKSERPRWGVTDVTIAALSFPWSIGVSEEYKCSNTKVYYNQNGTTTGETRTAR